MSFYYHLVYIWRLKTVNFLKPQFFKMRRLLLIVFFITYKISIAQSYEIFNQDTINFVDANNLKQGYWIFFGRMKKLPEYKDDQKVEEGKFTDSRKVGIWKKYFPNGNVNHQITYENGRPNGYYINYYEDGTLQEEGNWVNNKQIGKFKRFHENGKLSQDFNFNETGKREGVQKYFHENGKIMIEGSWNQGKESGVVKEYYENGDLKSEKVYNNGSFDAAASKTFEPVKPLPKPVEKIPENPTGTTTPPVVKAGESLNLGGVFNGDGKAVLFNKNKQVAKDGVFQKYKLIDGKEFIYNSDGILQRIAIYKNGIYVGDGLIEK